MLDSFKIVDLTHLITTSVPTWQGTASFSFTIIKDYHQGFRTQQFSISSNTGTHIDAPGHIDKSLKMVDSIPLTKLVVPAYVIDVSTKITDDYRISVKDIEAFEKKHGAIPADCLVIGYTGWSKRWEEHQQYTNRDDVGKMHFPGFSIEAAQLLINRKIAGIAIDTFSPDGGDETVPIHKMILKANLYIIENIMNVDLLPPTGAFVIALPIKILDAVEVPARVIGLLPPHHKSKGTKP